MKEPREWDEDYLLSLPLGEHNWVEMKGRRTLDLTVAGVNENRVREDLSKAISALANSGGGVLVLGLTELPNGWAIDDGGVALSVKGRMSTREWLEDVIPNLMEAALVEFNVYVITSNGTASSQIEGGRGVFVVEVGDSEQAPHQASDNKYYARVGGKSRPIGHRLVMDIVNRRRHPKLELSVEFHFIQQWKSSAGVLFDIPILDRGRSERETEEVLEAHFKIKNAGRVLVDYMQCSVWVPKGLFRPEFLSIIQPEVVEIEDVQYVIWGEDNIERDVTKQGVGPGASSEYGSSWYKRILPGMSRSWHRGLLRANMVDAYSNNHFLWEIVADNAPVERGRFRIGDIQKRFVDKTIRRGG